MILVMFYLITSIVFNIWVPTHKGPLINLFVWGQKYDEKNHLHFFSSVASLEKKYSSFLPLGLIMLVPEQFHHNSILNFRTLSGMTSNRSKTQVQGSHISRVSQWIQDWEKRRKFKKYNQVIKSHLKIR